MPMPNEELQQSIINNESQLLVICYIGLILIKN